MTEIAHFAERLAEELTREIYERNGSDALTSVRRAALRAASPASPAAPEGLNTGIQTVVLASMSEVERAYERGRADEREAIAKLVETWGLDAFAKCIRQRAQGEG